MKKLLLLLKNTSILYQLIDKHQVNRNLYKMNGKKLLWKVKQIESFLSDWNLKITSKILLLFVRRNLNEITKRNKKFLWIFFLKLKDYKRIFRVLLKRDKRIKSKLKRRFRKTFRRFLNKKIVKEKSISKKGRSSF